jgi:RNA polymerase sigma-70 factor (ECF subfamily)
MSIAHNLLANWYRDRGRRPPTASLDTALDVAADIPAPESSLERNELTLQVRTAVERLDADRQQLISLKYVDGLSNAEIGRIMGRTEGAIKSLHHRTLQQLHGALADVE